MIIERMNVGEMEEYITNTLRSSRRGRKEANRSVFAETAVSKLGHLLEEERRYNPIAFLTLANQHRITSVDVGIHYCSCSQAQEIYWGQRHSHQESLQRLPWGPEDIFEYDLKSKVEKKQTRCTSTTSSSDGKELTKFKNLKM